MVNSAHRPQTLKIERIIPLQPLLDLACCQSSHLLLKLNRYWSSPTTEAHLLPELAPVTEAHPLPKPVYLLKELTQNEEKKLEIFYGI